MTKTENTTLSPVRRGRPPKTKSALPVETCIPRLEPACRKVVERALRALEKSAVYRAEVMSNPRAVREYLKLKLAGLEREEMHAAWLDSQNRVISFEVLALGTIDQAQVYPREIVKSALMNNAAALILAHNHPSGSSCPSAADIGLTASLKSTLATINVRLLDHFIIAGNGDPTSLAERGLL